MSNADIIKRRKSVRTFTDEALKEEDRKKILDFANAQGNPYGIDIEYRILEAKEYGLKSPVLAGCHDTYIAGKMKKVKNGEEAFGYSFEKVLLFAEGLGVGTVWIAGTMNRDVFEKAMGIAEGDHMPAVSPLGYKAAKRSMKEVLMRKSIKADSRLDFGKIFFNGDLNTPLSKEAAPFSEEVAELVRLAPSAVNKQPWRIVIKDRAVHFYEKKSKGFIDKGWDIQKMDIGIAMCHFEMGMDDEGAGYEFFVEDPGISIPEGMEYIASYNL